MPNLGRDVMYNMTCWLHLARALWSRGPRAGEETKNAARTQKGKNKERATTRAATARNERRPIITII